LLYVDSASGAVVFQIYNNTYSGYSVGSKITIANISSGGASPVTVQPASGTSGSIIFATGYTGTYPAIKKAGVGVLYQYQASRWILTGDLE
jgi:hypothetical protein